MHRFILRKISCVFFTKHGKDGYGLSSVCMITSAKGGVGKTTVCANLGMALAMTGKRVLLIDCDAANRCLDLVMGLENEVLFGLYDVLSGDVPLHSALLKHPACEGLFLLPATNTAHSMQITDAGVLASLIQTLRDGVKAKDENETEALAPFDFIFLDTPGANPALLHTLSPLCDKALIISSGQVTAIRSAEKTASLLAEAGLDEAFLVVNAYRDIDAMFSSSLFERKKRKRANEAALTLFSIIDTVAEPLLAVIPDDMGMFEKQNKGLLLNDVTYKNTPFSHAIHNLAARLCAKHVPLFTKQNS